MSQRMANSRWDLPHEGQLVLGTGFGRSETNAALTTVDSLLTRGRGATERGSKPHSTYEDGESWRRTQPSRGADRHTRRMIDGALRQFVIASHRGEFVRWR